LVIAGHIACPLNLPFLKTKILQYRFAVRQQASQLYRQFFHLNRFVHIQK
jgi:hypothetical protein